MFDHVTVRVSDREASERVYDAVLETLGIAKTHSDSDLAEWADFSLSPADAARPVTTRLHIAFVAPSRQHVDRFWRAGIDAGHRDDGRPGTRPQYRDDYYGGFLLDPDRYMQTLNYGGARRGRSTWIGGQGRRKARRSRDGCRGCVFRHSSSSGRRPALRAARTHSVCAWRRRLGSPSGAISVWLVMACSW
jgi:catechol 2,3-dioxygenase-like lactoylglutathione lyase family enzyme